MASRRLPVDRAGKAARPAQRLADDIRRKPLQRDAHAGMCRENLEAALAQFRLIAGDLAAPRDGESP